MTMPGSMTVSGALARPDGALQQPSYLKRRQGHAAGQQPGQPAPPAAPQLTNGATLVGQQPPNGMFAKAAQAWQNATQQAPPAAVAAAPQQTFRQMQAQGVARPAPPPVTPMAQFQTPQSATNPQMVSQLQALLANPSAGRQEAADAAMQRYSRQIDDQFAQQEVAAREEMAARGLADSSIQGGRLADLNVGKRSAQTDMASQLMEMLASQQVADRQAALGLGMQFDNQQFGQNLAGFQANSDVARFNDQALMDRALFGEAQFQSDSDSAYRNNVLGSQNANASADRALQRDSMEKQFGLATRGQNFDEEMGRGQFGLQAGYFDIARENSSFDALLKLLGIGGDTSIAGDPAPPVVRSASPSRFAAPQSEGAQYAL